MFAQSFREKQALLIIEVFVVLDEFCHPYEHVFVTLG